MQKTLTKTIPSLPGVYLFKNAEGEVVYIGKAKSLHSRVHSYFQKNPHDWKIEEIQREYADLDFIITHSETEAMLLEVELIQQYQPRLNTIFKTGQPFLYIRFTTSKALPTMQIVRDKKRKGTHFGPFLHKRQARSAYEFLKRTFLLNTCNKSIENGCLDFHIDNCAGTCKSNFNPAEYQFRIELAKQVLRKQDKQFITMIKEKINECNAALEFEKSKHFAEYLDNVQTIFATIATKFAPEKFTADIVAATTPTIEVEQSYAKASADLEQLLGHNSHIRTIDCFDISHFQSQSIVGSCVRFTDGKPDKQKFRRFKIQSLTQQNDYAALQEIVARRYGVSSDRILRQAQDERGKNKKSVKKNINTVRPELVEGSEHPIDMPDLMLIDGGKGQLSAITSIFPNAPIISLAKREETLFVPQLKEGVVLDVKTDMGKLLIALRDYAHHFAISYHRLRRSKTATQTYPQES